MAASRESSLPGAGAAPLPPAGLAGFCVARLHAVLRLQAGGNLPPFLGPLLRGVLAAALRRLVCAGGCEAPARCPRRERCAYAMLFETVRPAGSERLRSIDSIPHPLVLEPPPHRSRPWQAGEELALGLVLVGQAMDYVPHLVVALEQAGKAGIGRDRLALTLERVAAATPGGGEVLLYHHRDGIVGDSELPRLTLAALPPLPAEDRVTLRLLAPVRLLEEGRLVGGLEFASLARALLRRLSALSYFHCGQALEADFGALVSAAASVRTVAAELRAAPLARWSARQQQRHPLDGVTGRIEYEGRALASFAGVLRLGELVHVGKGTIHGLGRYAILD